MVSCILYLVQHTDSSTYKLLYAISWKIHPIQGRVIKQSCAEMLRNVKHIPEVSSLKPSSKYYYYFAKTNVILHHFFKIASSILKVHNNFHVFKRYNNRLTAH